MSIKVLHLIGQLVRGGAERQLLYLTQALQERGWQQVVVSFNPGDVWDERVTGMGVPLVTVGRHSNKLRRLLQLSLVVARERPAIVHSWSAHTNVYTRWMLSSPAIRRIVSFRMNPVFDNYTGRPLTQIEHASTYARADCVISNSRFALECARAAGMRVRRAEVVTNFVTARGRAKPGENVAVPKIVAAGELIPCKAYDVLLRALGHLAAEGRSFELSLAGDGPERHSLEKLARQLGIIDRVRFLGSIESVPDLFSRAHLFVHSSRSEGLSNAVLEALGEGLPVVVTNVGGIPEVIEHGITGLLVAPDQPTLLANSIRHLLINPSLRSELGNAGLRHVRTVCKSSRVADQYEGIYRSVASGGITRLSA